MVHYVVWICITKRYRRGIGNTDKQERFFKPGQRPLLEETTLGRVPLPAWRGNTGIESPSLENVAKPSFSFQQLLPSRTSAPLGKHLRGTALPEIVLGVRLTESCVHSAFAAVEVKFSANQAVTTTKGYKRASARGGTFGYCEDQVDGVFVGDRFV